MHPTFAIYADTKRAGQCRSCRAVITWAELLNGKAHPFNGTITGRVRASLFPEARVVEEIDGRQHPSHFSTCPAAQSFRKGTPPRRVRAQKKHGTPSR